VIIKQLKEINYCKNGQKGKFDKNLKNKILGKKKKIGLLCVKNWLILDTISKISKIIIIF
jgi:hypothetical protein